MPPEVFTVSGRKSSLTHVPSPTGPITGSPFSVTTTPQTIGPFAAGAISMTVNTARVHVRFFRAGETVVPAGTGDVVLSLQAVGIHTFPVDAGDVMSVRSISGTAVLQITQARTN